MKDIILLIALLLIPLLTSAQSATIKDIDGWTNVRENPSNDSKVIYQVSEGEFFFWVSPEIEESNSKWAKVYISRNKYSLDERNLVASCFKGYIHRSRILPTDSLEEYQGNDFSFKYVLEEFSSEGKFIDSMYNEPYVINGRNIYGNDFSSPGKQVKDILVYIDGKRIPIHKVFFEDIFECSNEFKVYKVGESFIVNQWNSDGAGAYELTWVIDKSGVKQRLVGTII